MKFKPAWRGHFETEVVELIIPSGGAAIALIAGPAIGPLSAVSKICALGKDDLPIALSTDAKVWFAEGLKISGLREADILEIRFLGSQKWIDILTVLASGRSSLKIGKPVPLHDSASSLQFLPREGRLRLQKDPPKNESPILQVKSHGEPVKVLVVDDSETMRLLLSRIIARDPQLKFVGAVGLPSQVPEALERLKPDVMTLDIHMPEMNGVELLKTLLPNQRIPTVMISSLSKEDGSLVLDALEAGAVDYIQKPSMLEIATVAPMICEKIHNASSAQVRIAHRLAPKKVASVATDGSRIDLSSLILIGSSTGGTEALKVVLTALPDKIPGILIVQHIPPVFSKAFADRMNGLCPFEVKEAADGDVVIPNRVLIAPGGFQMKIRDRRGEVVVGIEDGDPVNRHKPSVDFLFDSAAQLKSRRMTAAIMTGMGADGAQGLLKLRQGGARTLAQNEETCTVYGMPREAAKLGAAERIVALDDIAKVLIEFCEKDRGSGTTPKAG